MERIPQPVVKFCLLSVAEAIPGSAAAVQLTPHYLVVVSDWLEGAKEAVRYGRTLYLSPAMWDLLVYADNCESMRRVWDAIPKVEIPGVVAAWEAPGWIGEGGWSGGGDQAESLVPEEEAEAAT